MKDNAVAEYRGMLGQPVEVNPLDALLMCIKITAGEVQWFTEQLEKITDKDDYARSQPRRRSRTPRQVQS